MERKNSRANEMEHERVGASGRKAERMEEPQLQTYFFLFLSLRRIFDFDLLDSHYEWHLRDKHFSRLFFFDLLNPVGIDIVKYEYITCWSIESNRVEPFFSDFISIQQWNSWHVVELLFSRYFIIALCSSSLFASIVCIGISYNVSSISYDNFVSFRWIFL